MASLTTNQPPTKRQRTTNESTEALQQERAPPPINWYIALPAEFESACGRQQNISIFRYSIIM